MLHARQVHTHKLPAGTHSPAHALTRLPLRSASYLQDTGARGLCASARRPRAAASGPGWTGLALGRGLGRGLAGTPAPWPPPLRGPGRGLQQGGRAGTAAHAVVLPAGIRWKLGGSRGPARLLWAPSGPPSSLPSFYPLWGIYECKSQPPQSPVHTPAPGVSASWSKAELGMCLSLPLRPWLPEMGCWEGMEQPEPIFSG